VPTDSRFFTHHVLVVILIAVVMLAGCRSAAPDLGPTSQPTPTFTPRSTPLPTIATPPPPGSEDNPIVMLFTDVRNVSRSEINIAVDDVSAALLESAGIAVDIQVAERGADALTALCASSAGPVAVAWVDGITYAAALAQACAVPALFIERENGTGEQIVIVVPSASTIDNIIELENRRFCRISVSDAFTWLVPALMMQASGVSPTSLRNITDYDDTEALLQAVADRDCDAAGIASADLTAFDGDVRELPQNATMPHAILMMPPSLPLGSREALKDALIALAENADSAALLQPLLAQTRIVRVTEIDLEGWDAFIAATGLNLATIGN